MKRKPTRKPPVRRKPDVKLPPESESQFWKPKGVKPNEDAKWLRDGGWSGKR